MVTRAFALGAAVVLLAGPAVAEQLPTWNVADICRGDSAPGQCSISEARARNTISASWDLLSADVRKTCLAETREPADQSWRILASCIEGEVLQARADRTIATSSTPAEPEPPQSLPPAAEPDTAEAAPAPAEAAIPDTSVAPATPDQPAGEATPPAPPSSAGQQ